MLTSIFATIHPTFQPTSTCTPSLLSPLTCIFIKHRYSTLPVHDVSRTPTILFDYITIARYLLLCFSFSCHIIPPALIIVATEAKKPGSGDFFFPTFRFCTAMAFYFFFFLFFSYTSILSFINTELDFKKPGRFGEKFGLGVCE